MRAGAKCLVGAVFLLALAATSASSQSRSRLPGADDAEQAYRRYRTAVQQATTIEQLLPFWGARLRHQFGLMEPDAQRETLALVRGIHTETTDIRIAGSGLGIWGGIGLMVEGVRGGIPMRGSVEMIAERDGWRLYAQEHWLPKDSAVQ